MTQLEQRLTMAITKTKQTTALVSVKEHITSVVQAFAATLSDANLPPAALSEVFQEVRTWQKNFDDLYEAGRQRVLALVVASGQQVTETGTKRLETEGWNLEIRPQKSGYDPKKVEAFLRAKNLSPSIHMDTLVTYTVSPSKLDALVVSGGATTNELAACKYELKWAVQPPKRTGASDEG